MILKQSKGGHLVEVADVSDLINPMKSTIRGCLDYGEERSDPEEMGKDTLCFPSGEALPNCWIDPHYRDAEAFHHYAGHS